ncbi:hypothetical protein C8Q80DRAFT_400945 [Daedaleopsis nitida]|nr:hypothetical protein C8Q80DRAFT_400945 [Daedaleopsis nitida]
MEDENEVNKRRETGAHSAEGEQAPRAFVRLIRGSGFPLGSLLEPGCCRPRLDLCWWMHRRRPTLSHSRVPLRAAIALEQCSQPLDIPRLASSSRLASLSRQPPSSQPRLPPRSVAHATVTAASHPPSCGGIATFVNIRTIYSPQCIPCTCHKQSQQPPESASSSRRGFPFSVFLSVCPTPGSIQSVSSTFHQGRVGVSTRAQCKTNPEHLSVASISIQRTFVGCK